MILIDWIIVILYIILLVGSSYFIGKKQKNQEDYFLGSKSVPSWQIGTSMAANQVSAISLVGAPAFIALKQNGGLKWLQYELAIPLAMIFLIIYLVPAIRKNLSLTIYEYLEIRFGTFIRLIISIIFLLSRSLATGVALLATSYVTSICINIPLTKTIILIGLISLIYTALGGIMADIYSDIAQMAVLWISSICLIIILLQKLHWKVIFHVNSIDRLQIFNLSGFGITSQSSYSLWPMLLGGFFLYISYYGCDQSQAQRLLAAKTDKEAQKSLLINSLIRYPLVLTYCFIGVLLIPFLANNPEFSNVVTKQKPDLLMPYFFNSHVPSGLLGLLIAGIFAASMSSLDSAINSLSASLWNDIIIKIKGSLQLLDDKTKIYISKFITIIWGVICTIAAIQFSQSTETVIELVNKIGSAFYGPIAGVFTLGFFIKRCRHIDAIGAFISGFLCNISLWLFAPHVSWLWWNLSGFSITLITGFILSFIKNKTPVSHDQKPQIKLHVTNKYIYILTIWFFIIIISSLLIEKMIIHFT